MKRSYELVLILDSEIKTEDQEQTVSQVKKIISNAKADLVSSKDWGKREFTYPINKKTSGSYLFIEYQGEPESVSLIKQKLQLENKIVRFLLTVIENKAKKDAGEKPVVKKKPAAKKSAE